MKRKIGIIGYGWVAGANHRASYKLSKDAEKDEKVVKLFTVEDKLPYGNLLFFTKKGMIKKTEWAEYEQRKDVFQALKLNEEDELINVEEDKNEEDTIIIVTEKGICLNAKKDDIPTQGRIAAGVHGISLKDDDSVVFMSQINEEGEIIIVTDEGKFKRVISSQIDPMARNRKGSLIVGMKEGAKVLCAAYVTMPYMVAVVEKTNAVSEISTERIPIGLQSARARKISAYAEDSIKAIYPLPHKKDE